MLSLFRRYRYFLLAMLVLSAIILGLFYNALKPTPKLPIYQPAMVHHELVDSTLQHVKKYHSIAPFALLNQNGDTVTLRTYENKIYIADFFFTTCPTICPTMTRNMAKIQEVIKDDPSVMLLSHTVTPEIDSVAVLKQYALKNGVIDHKWNLVTGDKKQLYDLARKSYLVVKDDGFGNPYDMIHTENFVLVDQRNRIRGYYDGTNDEEIKKLLADLHILKAESN
ncbi:MAG: SCO family protein [Capnocytophaga sp.]|nr:SCO family protein [Capnocytophaga sp.]